MNLDLTVVTAESDLSQPEGEKKTNFACFSKYSNVNVQPNTVACTKVKIQYVSYIPSAILTQIEAENQTNKQYNKLFN